MKIDSQSDPKKVHSYSFVMSHQTYKEKDAEDRQIKKIVQITTLGVFASLMACCFGGLGHHYLEKEGSVWIKMGILFFSTVTSAIFRTLAIKRNSFVIRYFSFLDSFCLLIGIIEDT